MSGTRQLSSLVDTELDKRSVCILSTPFSRPSLEAFQRAFNDSSFRTKWTGIFVILNFLCNYLSTTRMAETAYP
jgi:hypothetical protein